MAVLASGELLWLYRAAGIEARPAVVYGGNLSIVAGSWVPLLLAPAAWPAGPAGPALIFVAWLLVAFVVEIFSYRTPGGITSRLSATLFALCYVGLLLSFLVLLRSLPGGSAIGMAALLSLIVVVKLADIGAYTVGRLLGRHKMAPYLSPGKTIEGAVGGIAFGCAGAWFVLAWLLPRLLEAEIRATTWHWIAFGVLVGVAGILGDLAESLLKRDLGRKDSSALAARIWGRAGHRRLRAVCGAGRISLLAERTYRSIPAALRAHLHAGFEHKSFIFSRSLRVFRPI